MPTFTRSMANGKSSVQRLSTCRCASLYLFNSPSDHYISRSIPRHQVPSATQNTRGIPMLHSPQNIPGLDTLDYGSFSGISDPKYDSLFAGQADSSREQFSLGEGRVRILRHESTVYNLQCNRVVFPAGDNHGGLVLCHYHGTLREHGVFATSRCQTQRGWDPLERGKELCAENDISECAEESDEGVGSCVHVFPHQLVSLLCYILSAGSL